MKKANLLFFLGFSLLCSTAQAQSKAQFSKPIKPAYSRVSSSEAKYNIGITGGLTLTHWLHFGGTNTKYNQPLNFGPTGGLVVERMLNNSNSIAIEGLFAMRNTQLNYNVLNYPVSVGSGPEHNKDYYRQFDVNYQEVNVQVPLTHYFGQGNLMPYLFVAPRVSIPLSGKMIWQKKEIQGYGTENQQYIEAGASYDTVEMTAQNTRQWNVGIVVGAGLRYKLNMNNYYLFIKLDASAHGAILNSFTDEEIQGLSQNVIGAGYIDPFLLGMRFNTDATVKLTILFPLKKQLKGACMRWGEYD